MVVCRYLYVCEVCLALLGKGTSVTAAQHRKWDTPFFAIDPRHFIFHCTCSECIQICQHGADSAPLQKPTVMCSLFYLDPLSTSHVCPVMLLRCFHQSLTFLP